MNDAITEALKGCPTSLYQPEEEHDSCGVGFVAAINGERSNRVLRYGLTSACNMAHRGAMDADAKTGDGSGVLTQIPYKIFRREVAKLGHTLYNDSDLGVGFVFMSIHIAPKETPDEPHLQGCVELHRCHGHRRVHCRGDLVLRWSSKAE